MIRAILAVIAGYVIWTILWLAGGLGLMVVFRDQPNEAGNFDNAIYLGLAIVLSVACSVAGGFLCGKLARSPRPTAALVLGALLLLTGIGVQTAAWSTMPAWYHIVFLLLLVPVTLIGSRLGSPKPA